MKIFFIFLIIFFAIFTSDIKADYLNTKTSNQCVYDVTPYQNETGLCYTKRSNDQSYCSTSLRFKHLIDGYELINSDCLLKNDLKITGLTQNQWDYLLAVLAHIMGFTMLFLINFLSTSIARR